MNQKVLPIGWYKYEEGDYSTEKCIEILKNAQREKGFIICQVTEYDRKRTQLLINFHGFKGIIEKGYITKTWYTRPENLVGKAVRVSVRGIMPTERTFNASRLEAEKEAETELHNIQLGENIEGVIGNISDDMSCAFVDLGEGISGYLSMRETTNLPNTCWKMSEILKVGQKIYAQIIFVPNKEQRRQRKLIKLSLMKLQDTFEDACMNYEIGSVYEGFARKDKIKKNVHHIKINDLLYIRFVTKQTLDLEQCVKVKLTGFNYIDKYIEAEVDASEPKVFEPPLPLVERKAGSMFLKEIKTLVSPFAIRLNEDKHYESVRGSASMSVILDKYTTRELTEIHTNILRIVGKLGYSTTKQILSYAYSNKVPVGVNNQSKLNNKINTLIKNHLVEVGRFEGENGKGIYRFFSLSYLGERFLKYYIKESDMTCSMDIQEDESEKIKRILATNQFALACMEKLSAKFQYHLQETLSCADTKVRPSGLLEFEHSLVMIETLRRAGEWEDSFVNKCKRYEILIEHITKGTMHKDNPEYVKRYNKSIHIIMLCEDKNHVLEVRKIMNQMLLEEIIYFTHDLQMFHTDFEFSIYRINKQTDRVQYYSILDLFLANKPCYTEKEVSQYNISGRTFNSIPEEWIREMLTLGTDIQCDDVYTEDSDQNLEYLYRKEYKQFLLSSQLSRNRKDSEMLWEPRIFFFGNGGAGKTSLIKLLAGKTFDSEEPKTDGVQVFPDLWKQLNWMHYGGEEIKQIGVWDFAGQECDTVLTSFLISDAALCVLVVDSRREDYPDDWLNYIKIFAPRAKVLLVLNKIDFEHEEINEGGRKYYNRLNISYYLKEFPNIVGVYHISCKNPNIAGNDLQKLKQDICIQIFSMRNQFQNIWAKGINELRNWMRYYESDFMTMREFKRKHSELGLQERVDAMETLKVCVQAGVCIYHSKMKNMIVLKPQWLTCALGKLLKKTQFRKKKWKFSKEEIIHIIENTEDGYSYQYECGEGDELLVLMENLKICVQQGNDYFFPCFLPYMAESKSAEEILEEDNWYEIEIQYKSMPLDIFTELQAKLWTSQWNTNQSIYELAYEPDKSKIVFMQNGKKMLAYKKRNSIVIAIRLRNEQEQDLTNEEKRAIQEVKMYLNDIHMQHGLHRKEEGNIRECIVLKGRSNDLYMERTRIAYPKKYIQKMCMTGIKKQYFPEVDRWFNVADLLLDEYTEDGIMELYKTCVVKVLGLLDIENHSEIEAHMEGSGFLIPYQKEWYVVCCAHEVSDQENTYALENYYGERYRIEVLNDIYSSEFEREQDIAVCKIIREQQECGPRFPRDTFSFAFQADETDELYCRGYVDMEKPLERRNLHINQKQGDLINFNMSEEKVEKWIGMSGTPILNLHNRMMIGMLRTVQANCKGGTLISMDAVWNTVEKTIKKESGEEK